MSFDDIVRFDACEVTRIADVPGEGRFVEAGVVRGWAVSSEPLARLDLMLSGEVIATARLGVYRPDIGAAFPQFPHAEQAGFEATFAKGCLLEREPRLALRARTFSGRTFTVDHPIEIREGKAEATLAPIRMHVERCELDGRGVLTVSGWAVALSPVVMVQIFFGDEKLGGANIGLPRPDILTGLGAAYPNAGRAGFLGAIQLSAAACTTLDAVRVEVLARDGAVRWMVVPIHQHDAGVKLVLEADAVQPPLAILPSSSAGASEVHLFHDFLVLDTSGTLHLNGWAASPRGVTRVSAFLNEQFLGEALPSLPRPDVGRAYPQIVGAAHSGFLLRGKADGPLVGDYVVRIKVELADETEKTFELDTTATEAGAVVEERADQAVRLAVDGMEIQDGHARRPLTGAFHLVGWAVADAGIKQVEVFLGERSLGHAYHGIRREDVGAAFPNISGSLLSGYALSVPSRQLETGQVSFRVVASDHEHASSEVTFTADVDKSARADSPEMLRHKMPYAEAATALAILKAYGPLPLFDIVIRVSPSVTGLQDAQSTLETIVAQPFPHWRIWLSRSPGAQYEMLLDRLRANLPEFSNRIDYIEAFRPPTGPALCCVVNTGDLLAVDALLSFALEASGPRAGDLIYGDDRRAQLAGPDIAAFFKPDWSPDLLLSQNYIGRAWAAHTDLLNRLGLDLPALDAQGDYGATLLLTEAAETICHVPKVLLETNGGSEPPATERRALRRALRRRGIGGRVSAGAVPALHCVLRRPANSGKVSIIIPSIGARGHIQNCLQSIRRITTRVPFELVIVDNLRTENSDDAQRKIKEWFRANADIVVEADEPFNWSRLNNLGAAASTGEYLLFLNDDVEALHSNWLEVLVAEVGRQEVGIVGPQLLYPDGKVQHAGMFLSRTEPGNGRHAFRFADGKDPGYFGLALSQRNVSCVTGACMMVRRDVFEDVTGFEEAHSVVNNDVDFCLRVRRAGQLVVFTPQARLVHHELASRAELKDVYDKAAFLATWGDLCADGDPYHSPNLTSDADDYATEEEPMREVYAGHPLGDRQRVRNILAVKLDHIGDVVTALPAIRRLKQHFPNARLVALIGRSAIGIAQMERAIDEVIPFEFFDARSGLGQKALTKGDYDTLKATLQKYRFDLAIDLRKLGDTRHILQYTGAPILAGYDHERRFAWLDIMLEWERDQLQVNKRSHIADDLLNLVDSVANAFDGDRRTIGAGHDLPSLSDSLQRDFGAFLASRYVVVHPASGTPLRQWAPTAFARLIDLLIEEDGVKIVLIGGPDERDIAEKVIAAVRHRGSVADLVGLSRLGELPRIMAGSVLFVGNNSGPSHIAAGLGVPTVSIHSAVIASEEWGPLGPAAVALRREMSCAPCYIVSAEQCHRNMECLARLTPRAVHAVCRRLLSICTSHRATISS